MATVELLGDKMHKIFKEQGINYTKTYSKRCDPKKEHDAHYEVYEISVVPASGNKLLTYAILSFVMLIEILVIGL